MPFISALPTTRVRLANGEVEWMLDSGASLHFTNDINDFIQYRLSEEVVTVDTAETDAKMDIIGHGTVLLVVGDRALRVWPVFHVPALATRILSMGQFLQSGLVSYGSASKITLLDKKGVEFLAFVPRVHKDTLFVLRSRIGQHEDLAKIYSVTFDTMHRRMAHPSDEVMQKAGKYIKDFPQVRPETDASPCSGCSQGKMTNRSFPPSETRATEPFELIHSDLKSFPIDSYHKFRYTIVFYDDYTSHVWTQNLRTKDAALPAIKQYLALVENRFQAKVRKWMSDAGGEYTSKALTSLLRDKGIEILQSIPHMHQQNGRAERIIRTLSEKAETLQLQACLPQSWWEFALDHASHVYNRTPQRHLEWWTPHEWLTGERPSIDHFRVLGCGAYVFIPAEVRLNKLAPKSEWMTYLGSHPGGKGWIFMRSPNNVIFSATQATFDEVTFPKCPKAKSPYHTQLQTPAPAFSQSFCEKNGSCQCPPPSDDEVDRPREKTAGPSTKSTKGKQRAVAPQDVEDELPRNVPGPSRPVHEEPPQSSSSSSSEDEDKEPSPAPRTPSPVRQPQRPPPAPRAPRIRPVPQLPTRQSDRRGRPPTRPGNVYGEDRAPSQIERDMRTHRTWSRVVGDTERQRAPGPSRSRAPTRPASPVHPASDEGEQFHTAPGPEPTSEEELFGDAAWARLARDGGMAFYDLLVSKAITTNATDRDPKEWTYRDILSLPQDSLLEWKAACKRELETLDKRHVFDLVERPINRKVIDNRWVFDVKPDGRKRARLVAKGFSQVEGLDYDQIFSPVVRFETVRLILATAALKNWVAYGLDVRNAYLYGELDEEIYMKQPQGFGNPEKPTHVLRLRRALYGLKQAGLAWWRALKQSMEELGFKSLSSDAGIFVYHKDGKSVIAVIYVDDAIFIGPVDEHVLAMKEAFMKRWESRDLGVLSEFLHMRISREGSKIHLAQCAYLQTVLQRVGMQDAKSTITPLPAGYVPTPSEEQASPELRSRYQTIIGSLRSE